MAQSLRVGAGGSWPVFDETLDLNVVKQQSNVSCGAACGEMLLADRGVKITQDVIENASYAPIDPIDLVIALNKLDPSHTRIWKGGTIHAPNVPYESIIRGLNVTGSWSAAMWERGEPIAHLVVIDGFDESSRLKIRDPWEGTSYTMAIEDFLQVWMLIAIYALTSTK